jgi:hypothetical protein
VEARNVTPNLLEGVFYARVGRVQDRKQIHFIAAAGTGQRFAQIMDVQPPIAEARSLSGARAFLEPPAAEHDQQRRGTLQNNMTSPISSSIGCPGWCAAATAPASITNS